jgi:hypothetical protein
MFVVRVWQCIDAYGNVWETTEDSDYQCTRCGGDTFEDDEYDDTANDDDDDADDGNDDDDDYNAIQNPPEPCVMYTVTVTDVPSPQTAAQITVVLHAAGLPDTTLTDAASTVCGWGYRTEIPGPEWRDELRKKITDVVPPGRLVGIAFRVDVP